MKRLLSLLLAAIMVLSFASCSEKGEDDKNGADEAEYSASDIALSTENFSFTRAEISYIFHKNYSDFKLNYPDSIDMYNIDTGASLKDQVYHDDYTWFRYFADAAVYYAKQILAFCEGAKEAGVELTDEDRESIDAAVKTWTDYARDYDYKEDELFAKYFNSDVTADVLRSCMEKEMLYLRYESVLSEAEDFNFTNEQLESYVSENVDDFLYIDYLKFTVDEDDTSTPKAEAEKIASAKTPDEFLALAKEYLTNVKKDEDADKTLESCKVVGEKMKRYSNFSMWAFTEGSESDNSTHVEENSLEGEYTAYMLLKEPYTDTAPTKNVRIIKENVSSHNSFKETSDYLSEMLEAWKAGGGTEEAFAELAKKESEDENTKENGGLISNVNRFDTDVDEGIVKWLFEEERQVGDTGVVKGDKCYYAVLLTGEDLPGWEISARIGLAQNEMQEKFEELSMFHPVKVDNDVIDSLEG